MACLRQLISGMLTLILIMVYSVAEDTVKISNESYPHHYNILIATYPLHYNIQLELRVEENIFFGECDIDIKIIKRINRIIMFTENLDILQVTLMNDFYQKHSLQAATHEYDSEKKIIIFDFPDYLSPGYYILYLRYNGFISIKGGFKQFNLISSSSKKQGTIWISETYFQPLWLRRIFPCWPSSISTFKISIKYPNKYSVSSNMPIISVIEYKRDMKWIHFERTLPMSPYHESIIFTDLLVHGVNGDISIWCRNETVFFMEFALTITKSIMLYLEREWESFPIINYIAIPELQEQIRNVNLNFIVYNETDIIYDERKHNVAQKFNIMRLIGYEIIGKWFENLYTSDPLWSTSWLKIGFPILFATHVLNQSLPNTRIIDLFVVQVQHESLKLDVDKGLLPLTDQIEIVPTEIVNRVRAPVILRMLQHIYNIKIFWRDFHKYLYETRYTFRLFWKNLKIIVDEIDGALYGTEHKTFPWGEQKGYPVLTVIRDYNTSAGSMNVSIENIDFMKDERAIPVSYTTLRDLNFHQTQPYIWFFFPINFGRYYVLNLGYTEQSWVIFNIQQIGYYRVNYDEENWARISAYLNSKDYWKIHVLNRAQLIDDAFNFMLLGKLKYIVFWQLTKYLQRETDYIAWYPMFKAMEYMSRTFPFYYFWVHFIQTEISNMLEGLLQKITYEEKSTDDDFTKSLRQEAVQWICKLDQTTAPSKCIEMANIELKQHLIYNTNLSPWWKKWAYCYGLARADKTIWNQVLNEINGNNDKIIYLITCPNYLIEIYEYIILTTYNKDYVGISYKPAEHDIYNDKTTVTLSSIVQTITKLRHFVYTIIKYSSGDLEMFNYVLYNFNSIKPRFLSTSTALLIFINNIRLHGILVKVNNTFLHLEPKIQYKIEVRKQQIRNGYQILKRCSDYP